MNTALVNLSDDEITQKFAEAFKKTQEGNFKEFATVMADFNALQRPDDDPLKIALLKTGGMLMGGQVEALDAHQDMRRSMELMLEWIDNNINPKFAKKELHASLHGVAVYFLASQNLSEFKKMIDFVKDMKDSGIRDMMLSLPENDMRTVMGQMFPAKIADKAVEHMEAERKKTRTPRKKK